MRWPVFSYRMEEEVPLPRRKVWELISNTDHLDRVIGLFPIEFGPAFTSEREGIFRQITAKVGGIIPLRWSERPFEWVKYKGYASKREYKGAILRSFSGGVELEDGDKVLPGGQHSTKVRLFAHFTPAGPLGMAAIPLVGRRSMVKMMKYLSHYIRLAPAKGEAYLPQPRGSYPVNKKELAQKMRELARMPVPGQLLGQLKEHLSGRGDDEVLSMRPYVLAERWGADRDDVLRLYLYATQVGLTNLNWSLICPNCRVPKVSMPSLRHLQDAFHCDFCGINYNASFDRYVELRFSVHPSVRKAEDHTYCISGPGITPHIYEQRRISRGAAVRMSPLEWDSRCRLRVLKHNHILPLGFCGADGDSNNEAGPNVNDAKANVDDGFRRLEKNSTGGAEALKLAWSESGWSELVQEGLRSGDVIEIRNDGTQEIVVALEAEEWDDYTVTAAKVTTMHEFRGMFSSEVLAPGEQVGIESVTLLFSDLRGSTSFYEQVGDAQAYGQVRKHFDFMRYWIHNNHGAIVKTIGDAVMAVFETPEDALEAAIAIQLRVDDFNAKLPENQGVVVKIGLHHGPAIAVTSNEQLDYFGRTVNMAARIQHLSVGGDIVLSEECLQREGTTRRLQSAGLKQENEEVELKGIDGPIRVARVWVSPQG